MAFRVLVITESTAFYRDMEVAFEPLPLLLLCEGTSLLALPEPDVKAYLATKKVNVVVHAGFSPSFGGGLLSALTGACEAKSIPLIYISSYQVFSEQQFEAPKVRVQEHSTPIPCDALGEALLSAEHIVLACGRNMVVRAAWTLVACSDAPEDEGLLDRACKALLGGTELQVSENVAGFVVSWPEVARTVTAMIQQILCGAESWGVFHARSSDSCSEAEFVDAAARLLKAEGFSVARVVPTKGAGYLMQRSALLGGRRSTDDFGIQQKSFRVGLKGAVQRWVKRSGYIPALEPVK